MDNRSIIRKFLDWLLAGGVMKTIGRSVTLLAIIAALVITAIGVVNMYQDAAADRDAAFEKAYTKQQSKEYKAKQKENDKAIKAGQEPPHVLPENVEDYEVENVPVVKLSLDDHIGPFITKWLLWAIVVLAAGILVGWIISNILGWFAAMKAAGPVRVTAGVFLWAGLLIAAGFLIAGLVEILQINKSTLPEVGKILMEKYLVWSVVAAGTGYAINWMILRSGAVQQNAFDSVGLKLRAISKVLFYVTLVAFAALAIATVCMLVLSKWTVAAILGGCAVVALVGGWIGSTALEALGTCTMIMEPQAKEAEAREHARRHAVTWVCPVCGKEHARSVATCECGAVKPVH